MELLRGHVGKWLLSCLYLGVWVGLTFLIPFGLGLSLVAVHVLFATYLYLTLDTRYGRSSIIRPLTHWDVSDYRSFRTTLRSAVQDLGLRLEPVWAVAETDELNAWAVGGRRGLVVFTTGLLRQLSPDEVLAVAGHELFHLRSHDSLPAVVGGAWLFLVGRFSAWCDLTGRRVPGLTAVPLLVLSMVLDAVLAVVGYLASAVLARRSRTAERLADRAGAYITSVATMCSALERLEQKHPTKKSTEPRWSLEWLQQRLHASHPPTPERLAYLREIGTGV